MKKQDTLKPIDLVVAISLALRNHATGTYSELAEVLGVSASTAFEAVQRLQRAGLIRPGSREPNVRALRNFLAHGAKPAFPPALGREVQGVPTAHAAPALRHLFDSDKPVVWPSAKGSARGTSLTPLYPRAVELPTHSPSLYNALALVDALRVGQARERNAAMSALDDALGVSGRG